MRVICDTELCQGHGRCEAMAPDIFSLDSNGYNKTPVIEVTPDKEAEARIAVQCCPEEILRIEED